MLVTQARTINTEDPPMSTTTRVRVGALTLLLVCAVASIPILAQPESGQAQPEEHAVHVHYLEIVTPKVDETCDALEQAHSVTFGAPVAELGNARTASLHGGGRIGVRGPLRETEAPVVRPYVLVDDIEAAVEAARKAGSEIALPPTNIQGQGTIAIYILGGIQHGLWQL